MTAPLDGPYHYSRLSGATYPKCVPGPFFRHKSYEATYWLERGDTPPSPLHQDRSIMEGFGLWAEVDPRPGDVIHGTIRRRDGKPGPRTEEYWLVLIKWAPSWDRLRACRTDGWWYVGLKGAPQTPETPETVRALEALIPADPPIGERMQPILERLEREIVDRVGDLQDSEQWYILEHLTARLTDMARRARGSKV